MKNSKPIFSINSNDFIEIQSFLNKLKIPYDSTHLQYLQVKPAKGYKLRILATNGYVLLDKEIPAIDMKNFKEPVLIPISSIKSMNIERDGFIELVSCNDKKYLRHLDSYSEFENSCDDSIPFPNIDEVTKGIYSNKGPVKATISFNLDLLNTLKPFLQDSRKQISIEFRKNNTNHPYIIKGSNGQKLGIIMPITH